MVHLTLFLDSKAVLSAVSKSITIGRAASSTIIVEMGTVSTNHCNIRWLSLPQQVNYIISLKLDHFQHFHYTVVED